MDNPFIIQVQKRPLDNFGHPLLFLIKAAGEINSRSASEIIFNFNECRFVHPFVLCGISVLRASLINKKTACQFQGLDNPALAGYFTATGFPEGISITPGSDLSQYNQKNFIPLTVFPAQKGLENGKDQCIEAVGSIIRQQCKLPVQLYQAVQYFISELAQNITDHSSSANGYVFAQYYPSKMYLDLCMADTGIGLQQSYLQSGRQQPQNHYEAMNLALNGFSTKELPESRGFGIPTTRRMLIEGLTGKFFMWSGNAVAYQNNEKLDVIALNPNQYFKGVYLALRIPVKTGNGFNLYDYIS